jgi:hypothetical protein
LRPYPAETRTKAVQTPFPFPFLTITNLTLPHKTRMIHPNPASSRLNALKCSGQKPSNHLLAVILQPAVGTDSVPLWGKGNPEPAVVLEDRNRFGRG